MKKLLLLSILLLFSLTGCAETKSQKTTISAPYEILFNNTNLSYYDTENSISSEIKNNILFDTNGIIRCISVTDKTIETYKGISVGDNINKIEDNFSYEYKSGDNYMVIFNNNVEENPTNKNKEDNWIWINYITDDHQITQIQIYDVKYGREMR